MGPREFRDQKIILKGREMIKMVVRKKKTMCHSCCMLAKNIVNLTTNISNKPSEKFRREISL